MVKQLTTLIVAHISRISLCMAGLACVFWVVSWPFWLPYYVAEGIPNCVAARWDGSLFAIGCVSHHRLSSLFLTREFLEPGLAFWGEYPNGHFCGFPIPTSQLFNEPRIGLNIHVGLFSIAWDCPYALMVVAWIGVFLKTVNRIRFGVRDLMWATVVVSIAAALIRLRIALLCVVLLNVCTAMLFALLVINAIRALIVSDVKWWPLTSP